MRRMAVALVAFPLAACMMGPNYHRPSVEAPPAWRFEMAEARDTANTAWWHQFGDPVLDGLIADALAHNLNVQIAAANVEQAAAVLTQAKAPLYPQVGYSGDASKGRGSETNAAPIPSSVPNPQTAYQVLAGASWELDLWGRIRRLSEAARAQLYATQEARRGVVLTLVSAVATSFESAIAQTENALSILLGRNPGEVPRGLKVTALALPPVPSGIPSEVLEQRPDVRQAEQTLVAANARIGAAKALYVPTISLTGSYGTSSAELGGLFKGPSKVWSYAGSIVGPIFTGGATRAGVRQAEAARKATELGYVAAVQSAFADADDALVSRQKLAEQLDAQGRLVRAAREYARLARLQFDGGVAPYMTVLQAEQALFPAELNEVQTRASLFASTVNVYKAMGGGWVTEAEALTR